MTRTNTIDYGIDLGTTTSCIAKFIRNTTVVIPNSTNDSMNYTPSAVYLQKRKCS